MCGNQTYYITASNCRGSTTTSVTIRVVDVAPTMCAVVGGPAEGRCLTVTQAASLEVLVDEASDPITKNRVTWTGSSMDTAETLATSLPGLSLSKEGFLAGTPM